MDRTLVRTARALVDWTQPDLAKAAGFALATLKRFEKGYRVPTDRTLAKIFKVLKKAGVEFHADGNRREPRCSQTGQMTRRFQVHRYNMILILGGHSDEL
jgi:transcriptional regulator with XRE-family HTH domain